MKIPAFGDKLGRYIDPAEPKGRLFTGARIYVEMDLEKGLMEALWINMVNWNRVQELDYVKTPFKCNSFHECGNFAKSFQRNQEKPLLPKKPMNPNSQKEHNPFKPTNNKDIKQ